MNLNELQANYFELFGLPANFAIDPQRLDAAYRELQSQVHPDRFASASGAERRRSMQWATLANEAYQTLREPLSRARYLVQLHGVATDEKTNTAMPVDFLVTQMEWREAVADAKADRAGDILVALANRLTDERKTLLAGLARRIDAEHDYPAAAEIVRKLRFMEKLEDEIGLALEALEAGE